MSRPVQVEIVPSHVHLSAADHAALFGTGHTGTISENLSQHGQYAYTEMVEVKGRKKAGLSLRILGPYRKQTQVEITPTEAEALGIKAPEAKSGDLSRAAKCVLKGPRGELKALAAVIVPQPHLHASEEDAKAMRIKHGDVVTMELLGGSRRLLEDVVVRVHPTYKLRLHVHPDLARAYWLTGVLHARLRDLNP
jgi:propanediol utilization protein